MEPYSLRFKASVEKDLRRIPADARARCLRQILGLRTDPRPRGTRRLTGSQCTYRVRAGTYRTVYEVDEAHRTVTVLYVRHRKDAYR